VLQHLHEFVLFKSFHLHWVPHLLTGDLIEKGKEYAKAMLPFLHAAKCDGWHHLETGDWSWLFFNILPGRMWTLLRDNVVTKPRRDGQSKKLMCIIIWNPSGFYIVKRLPNPIKTNNAYFVTNLRIPFEKMIFPRGRAPHKK
jgi:hypothetical protein